MAFGAGAVEDLVMSHVAEAPAPCLRLARRPRRFHGRLRGEDMVAVTRVQIGEFVGVPC